MSLWWHWTARLSWMMSCYRTKFMSKHMHGTLWVDLHVFIISELPRWICEDMQEEDSERCLVDSLTPLVLNWRQRLEKGLLLYVFLHLDVCVRGPVFINTGSICSTYQHRGGSCKLQVEHLHCHSQATTQRTLGRISPERLTARSVNSGEKDPKTLMWSTHCAVEPHRRYSSFTGNAVSLAGAGAGAGAGA